MQNNSDDDDIKMLFERIRDHFADADEGSRAMFSMLVSTTLRYRDMLVHSSGSPLTVAEARSALDAFMHTLKAHKLPEGLDRRVHDLVIMWLEGLREKVQN